MNDQIAFTAGQFRHLLQMFQGISIGDGDAIIISSVLGGSFQDAREGRQIRVQVMNRAINVRSDTNYTAFEELINWTEVHYRDGIMQWNENRRLR